jgi:anhydro-N-acetylmuramic acid kinase
LNPLKRLSEKPSKLVIGLMSGTSADGIDAALVRIEGSGFETRVEPVAFVSLPYEEAFRSSLLELALGNIGGSRELCLMNFRLGRMLAEASLAVCEKAKLQPGDVDLIGSHGHTFYHQPSPVEYLGGPVAATLQLGEASFLNEAFGCPVVSDFRVRDMAAGGQGAPLVPYTEYLLYRSESETIALQNIGGIGNVTLLPKACSAEDVIAFDTGPGNMVIDALVRRFTEGRKAMTGTGKRQAGEGSRKAS